MIYDRKKKPWHASHFFNSAPADHKSILLLKMSPPTLFYGRLNHRSVTSHPHEHFSVSRITRRPSFLLLLPRPPPHPPIMGAQLAEDQANVLSRSSRSPRLTAHVKPANPSPSRPHHPLCRYLTGKKLSPPTCRCQPRASQADCFSLLMSRGCLLAKGVPGQNPGWGVGGDHTMTEMKIPGVHAQGVAGEEASVAELTAFLHHFDPPIWFIFSTNTHEKANFLSGV